MEMERGADRLGDGRAGEGTGCWVWSRGSAAPGITAPGPGGVRGEGVGWVCNTRGRAGSVDVLCWGGACRLCSSLLYGCTRVCLGAASPSFYLFHITSMRHLLLPNSLGSKVMVPVVGGLHGPELVDGEYHLQQGVITIDQPKAMPRPLQQAPWVPGWGLGRGGGGGGGVLGVAALCGCCLR
jgi:hypothetical protein